MDITMEKRKVSRITFAKKSSTFFYLSFKIIFDAINVIKNISMREIHTVLHGELVQLYGEDTDMWNYISVLKYNDATSEGILRIKANKLVQLWSVMTLITEFKNQSCRFEVYKISPCLISLSKNSRRYQHRTVSEDLGHSSVS